MVLGFRAQNQKRCCGSVHEIDGAASEYSGELKSELLKVCAELYRLSPCCLPLLHGRVYVVLCCVVWMTRRPPRLVVHACAWGILVLCAVSGLSFPSASPVSSRPSMRP